MRIVTGVEHVGFKSAMHTTVVTIPIKRPKPQSHLSWKGNANYLILVR